MALIKTKHFVIDPHHGSGYKIIIPELQRKKTRKNHKCVFIPLEERPIIQKPKKVTKVKEYKNNYKENKWNGIVPEHIRKKTWLLKDPSYIYDNYVYFEPL